MNLRERTSEEIYERGINSFEKVKKTHIIDTTFPYYVFHENIIKNLKEYVDNEQIRTESILHTILIGTSALIGNKMKIRVHDKWIEKPSLYGIYLAKSSQKKSVAFNKFTEYLKYKHKKLFNKYALKIAEEKANENGKPEEVPHYAFSFEVATYEALVKILEDNENGVILLDEEFSDYLDGLSVNKNTRESSLIKKIWSLIPYYQKDTKTAGRNFLINPHLSILGLAHLSSIESLIANHKGTDGFLYRFLICTQDKNVSGKFKVLRYYEDTPDLEKDIYWIQEQIDNIKYQHTIDKKTGKINSKSPQILSGSKPIVESIMNEYFAKEMQFPYDDNKTSIVGKMHSYLHRIALNIEVINQYAKLLDTKIIPPNHEKFFMISDSSYFGALEIIKYYTKQAFQLQEFFHQDSLYLSLDGWRKLLYDNLPEEFKMSEVEDIWNKYPECDYQKFKDFCKKKKLFRKIAGVGKYQKIL